MLVSQIKHPLVQHIVSILRDENTEPPKFREYMRKLGRYLLYEASSSFTMADRSFNTPVAPTVGSFIDEQVVILSVLRAAMPMASAIHEELDGSSLGMVSASRGSMIGDDGRGFKIRGGYHNIPSLDAKTVIIVDPMLASGSTILYLLDLISNEKPRKILLLVAIASTWGVSIIENKFPEVDIYAAAVDKELNNHGYIVPGLGDAGDRCFNT